MLPGEAIVTPTQRRSGNNGLAVSPVATPFLPDVSGGPLRRSRSGEEKRVVQNSTLIGKAIRQLVPAWQAPEAGWASPRSFGCPVRFSPCKLPRPLSRPCFDAARGSRGEMLAHAIHSGRGIGHEHGHASFGLDQNDRSEATGRHASASPQHYLAPRWPVC